MNFGIFQEERVKESKNVKEPCPYFVHRLGQWSSPGRHKQILCSQWETLYTHHYLCRDCPGMDQHLKVGQGDWHFKIHIYQVGVLAIKITTLLMYLACIWKIFFIIFHLFTPPLNTKYSHSYHCCCYDTYHTMSNVYTKLINNTKLSKY